MIFLNDGDKSAEAPKAIFEEQMPQDPPPTYTSVQSETIAPLPGPSSFPSNVVNYVSISRKHGHIKETLTVDPSFHIPQRFRARLAEGESESSRKNVRLESVHGYIEAEITLQDKAALEARGPLRRATLQLSTTHGGIKVAIPDHPQRPPFLLTAKTREGNIRLALPRSFTGPITVSYDHGDVKASSLGGQFITLSETNGKMNGFIGDLSKYDDEGKKGWKGDEVVLDLKHGSAKLRFYEDGDAANSRNKAGAGEEGRSLQQLSPRKSIFSKIFGLS